MTDAGVLPEASAPIAACLQGRIAFVTGASSGVGRELALGLAAAGAKVALGARRVERLKQLEAEISAMGAAALAVPLDVEEEGSIRAAYDLIEDRLGVADTIVVNAGVQQGALAVDLATEDLDWILRVNVRGSFLTAREGARRLLAAPAGARNGRVIFIASIAASTVIPGAAAYCGSKAAVVMMAMGMAKEWARYGINVNAVCPGFMLTELTHELLTSEAGKRQLSGYPRRRAVEVADLTGAVTFLASEAAAAITGAVLTIDDGQTL